MPLIPALGRQRQADLSVRGSLIYRLSSRTARITVSKTKQNKTTTTTKQSSLATMIKKKDKEVWEHSLVQNDLPSPCLLLCSCDCSCSAFGQTIFARFYHTPLWTHPSLSTLQAHLLKALVGIFLFFMLFSS